MPFDYSVAARGAVVLESTSNHGETDRWIYFLEGAIEITITPEYSEYYPDMLLFSRPPRLNRFELRSITSGGFMYRGDMPNREDMETQKTLDIPRKALEQ